MTVVVVRDVADFGASPRSLQNYKEPFTLYFLTLIITTKDSPVAVSIASGLSFFQRTISI